ncbi:hypothetical protein RGU70_14080 [Herbaspirillum sp. RTI4]|uniref:hypothetical protein n=1 Tax=Herbaspirillum sp. RTI4 TaxID=3048640 RepID=UPI002AB43CBA|nr:hypothetical protein [Herbaspirillum sp. RTI4]MDY7579443.1 hypothetical protein [Herbaspirillum sp. RTI4]MEA9980357.1 hypothetical protein [Herbaspirillum sp. RTI4]
MRLDELPDLSYWRYVEVWTVEEAAMIWAGINPLDHEGLRISALVSKVPKIQHQNSKLFQRAISEAVCVGTLSFESAWEDHEDYQNGPWEKKVEFPDLPDSHALIQHKTRIKQAAFLQWTKSKNIPSYRQILQKKDAQEYRQELQIERSAFLESRNIQPSPPNPILQLAAPAYMDANNPLSPLELRVATRAWEKVAKNGDPRANGKAVRAAIGEAMKNDPEYKSLSGEAIERIKTVSNWNKNGGATKTPE